VRLDDAERSGAVAAAQAKRLGGAYRAITWQELNGDLISAVKLEQLVSSIIMGLMLFVAALNIIASLVLTTLHRLREISLLQAIGLPDRGIERLLVGSGMWVGVRGIAAGMAAGVLVALAIDRFHLIPLEAEIYLIGALPIDISGSMCGILAIFGGGLLWLTSRFAARRLCTIRPAEGLAQAR
jgi:lipoprotein-releasing system permease protein